MKQTKRTELLFDCLSFCFHQCSAETAATSNIHLRDISILPSQSNSGSCLDEQHLCCRSRCRWRLVLFSFSLVCLSVFLSLNTTQLLNCWNQHIFCCCCWYFLIRRVYHFCRLSEKRWLVLLLLFLFHFPVDESVLSRDHAEPRVDPQHKCLYFCLSLLSF